MAKFTVDIDSVPVGLGGYATQKKPSRLKKIAVGVLAVVALVAIFGSIGFYFYWQSFKATPQYSLASIVDAAKSNDQATVSELVDIDAVVDDFLPQITDKAVELYGRGLAPDLIQRVARVAAPVMPALKDRAREELPGAIRQKTDKFGSVPFVAMVLGADRYLNIVIEGGIATVTSKLPEHNFEVRMKRAGDKWKIVAVKDEELATRIAQKVGQEIIGIATNGPRSGQSKLGLKTINDLLKEAEEIFK